MIFPQGIWLGMLCGTLAQTVILLVMVYKANWNKEVTLDDTATAETDGKNINLLTIIFLLQTSDTEDRIRRWAGEDGVSEPAGRDLVEK